MKVSIKPSQLNGHINVSPSKSSMQRACAAALITKGKTVIYNAGNSEDDKAAISIIKALGAKVKSDGEKLEIESVGVAPVTSSVNCGESGLCIRMFTPIIALSGKEMTINGEGSLLHRPMDFFDSVLPQLGVKVESNNGKLPIKIKGPLRPANIEVNGSISSQFLTGLLLAYAASPNPSSGGASEDSVNSTVSIKVRNLNSKPYIDLTLGVIKHFGLNVPKNKGYKEFKFSEQSINKLINQPINYTVEGDWSGGAFLLVAGAIAGPIAVRGLDLTSTQADKSIMDALIGANASVAVEAKGIIIHPGRLRGFHFDATDCPDLFPPLVALAAYCDGDTTIKGTHRLIHKESNRAAALVEEFGKMCVIIKLEDDGMIIKGNKKLKGSTVHSHHDHRIAMACAIAALKADGETVIEEAHAINKSYPDFYHHLKKLGADVSLPFSNFLHE